MRLSRLLRLSRLFGVTVCSIGLVVVWLVLCLCVLDLVVLGCFALMR